MSLAYDGEVPVITAKKKCCEDKPRCKKCPVTLHRLSRAGYAERLDLRRYRIDGKVPGKALKTARKR